MAKLNDKPVNLADYGGFKVAKGQTLNLQGATVKASSSLHNLGGTIKNGIIVFSGEKHSAAINCEKGYKSTIAGISVTGGSYNGLAKVWGDGTKIVDCEVVSGTGWGVMVLGADDVYIAQLRTKDLRRGGIYFGDGTAYGTHFECTDCVVEACVLDGADEEAVFRANTCTGLIVRNSFFDNTRCRVGKEAVQPRGISGLFENCTILGSTSSGQQPNGISQTANFRFLKCTIFGYNSIEAGGDVTFERCNLSQGNTVNINGKIYTLKTPGNGCLVNPQKAARGLPDGRALVKGCTIAGPLTKSPKKVTVE